MDCGRCKVNYEGLDKSKQVLNNSKDSYYKCSHKPTSQGSLSNLELVLAQSNKFNEHQPRLDHIRL